MTPARRFAALIARFRAQEAAAAAVEFALILPIMLVLYTGANEASVLISMDRKVQLISGTVGDLVARSEGDLSEAVLADYVKVASGLVSPYVAPGMVQVVSQVQVSLDGTTTNITWSRGFTNQQADSSLNRAIGSTYTLPAAVTDIARGQSVIVAETGLPYIPLFGLVYSAPINLYRENFYLPRFGGSIALK
ncbi:MAG: pilus assembly protein [Devosia sp.]|nr:pilus assembly protein [Devosia sp.]